MEWKIENVSVASG